MIAKLKYLNFAGILRIVLGVAVLVQAIILEQYFFIPIGIYLLYQVFFGKRCGIYAANNQQCLITKEDDKKI